MSILIVNYLADDELIEVTRNFNHVYCLDSFTNKLEKALIALKHHLRGLLDQKIINVYQGGTKIAVNPLFRNRKVNILLNHGWGTKRSPGNLDIQDRKRLKIWRKFRKYTDYVICYSDFDSTYFMRHPLLEDLPLPKFIPLGHPRNDFLVREKENEYLKRNVKRQLGIPENKKIILFAPTYRESDINKANKYDLQIMEKFITELKGLDKICDSQDSIIIFRPHYFFTDFIAKELSKARNIMVLTSKKARDPRLLMLISDILVTDYSSIYVDYLLLERPIVFFQPDLEVYQQIRGLVVDPNNPLHVPGPKISSLRDIFDLDQKEFAKYDLKSSKKFFHKYDNDRATKRLIEFINGLLVEGIT